MDDFDDQIKQTTKNPWYAVRTFNCQELKISDFLKGRKKVHFVPMTYVEKEKEGKTRKMLVPVVHNLVFLQKNESRKAMLAMLKRSAMFLSACFATKKQSIPVRYPTSR